MSRQLGGHPVRGTHIEVSCAKTPSDAVRRITASSSKHAPIVRLGAPPLRCDVRPIRRRPCSRCAVRVRTRNFRPGRVTKDRMLTSALSERPAALGIVRSNRTFREVMVPPRALFCRCPPGVRRTRVGPVGRGNRVMLDGIIVPRCVIMRSKPIGSSTTNGCCMHCGSCVGGMTDDRVCTA